MRRGDRGAFSEFDNLYYERIRALARKLLATAGLSAGEAEDASRDITQEVLLRVFTSIHTLREPEALEVWFCRICANVVKDDCRARRRRPPTGSLEQDEFDSVMDTANLMQRIEDAAEVEAVLKRLPQEDEDLLRMRHGEGMSVEEIAWAVGRPPERVKQQLHAARVKARKVRESSARA
jgi:RNA polymerase sigma-70 factor (ECF subfamily)